MGTVSENLERIRALIDGAARRSGREAAAVRLMAVTKTQPVRAVEEAVAAGLSLFGENRVGEIEEKFTNPPPGVEIHLIGHLQRNKAQRAARLVRCVQSVDKVETALALDRVLAAASRTLRFYIEINTSGEDTKSGYPDAEAVLVDMERYLSCEHLELGGLMTIGPLTDDEKRVRESFRRLAQARRSIEQRFPQTHLVELSMGMSHDFQIAVEEGATMVRIGTALFGARTTV